MPPRPGRGQNLGRGQNRHLTAIGVTCGIGSMLIGARQAGFRVLGNIEWRRYYHVRDLDGKNTFTANFPNAFLCKHIEDLEGQALSKIKGCDLAMGHPECGAYSQMQGCNNFRGQAYHASTKAQSPGDIPLFVDMIAALRPRFFAMDDLPKSLQAFPMSEYARRLPQYDLFPEWVSNYHYGNIQKNRRRMFMIGARKSERWIFTPNEREQDRTLEGVIGDLPVNPVAGGFPNHDPHTVGETCGRGLHMDYPWHRPTWGDMQEWFARVKEGTSFRYYSPHAGKGETKVKPGWYKQRWSGTCAVLDGGSGHMHPLRNLPFTLRERARIQGFPDSFILYGTRLNEVGEWNHERNIDMLKQTGKAMPVQFCRYLAGLVRRALLGQKPVQRLGSRLVRPNPYIDQAKQQYCSEVGYSNQQGACLACWIGDRCTLSRRR